MLYCEARGHCPPRRATGAFVPLSEQDPRPVVARPMIIEAERELAAAGAAPAPGPLPARGGDPVRTQPASRSPAQTNWEAIAGALRQGWWPLAPTIGALVGRAAARRRGAWTRRPGLAALAALPAGDRPGPTSPTGPSRAHLLARAGRPGRRRRLRHGNAGLAEDPAVKAVPAGPGGGPPVGVPGTTVNVLLNPLGGHARRRGMRHLLHADHAERRRCAGAGVERRGLPDHRHGARADRPCVRACDGDRDARHAGDADRARALGGVLARQTGPRHRRVRHQLPHGLDRRHCPRDRPRRALSAAGRARLRPVLRTASLGHGARRLSARGERADPQHHHDREPEAIDRLDDILAVPGIDVVVIASFDLSMAMDGSGRFDDPELLRLVAAAEAEIQRAGLPLGGVALSPNAGAPSGRSGIGCSWWASTSSWSTPRHVRRSRGHCASMMWRATV